MEGLFTAWGKILAGRAPNLSIEITRECPLRCPGCYAFGDDHLGGDVTLREVHDYKGDALVQRMLQLIDEHRPVHLSIVGGEPLVRFRELNTLLPILAARGLHTQLVTSAVRPIPPEWAALPRLQIVVSIDGLAPEHDVRRAPATYDRVLKHIAGHQVTVHCTVTRQQVQREGYLEEFVKFWSANVDTRQIWVSLYTPQIGEAAPEILTPADRERVVIDLLRLRTLYPKLKMPKGMIEVYRTPPESPDACVFAQTTTSLSADLERRITPCQFGGNPDCSQCGCIATAGLEAVARHRLGGRFQVGWIYWSSLRIGRWMRGARGTVASPPRPPLRPSAAPEA
jgi:MoaA/NifB/PqqE/SkfB family radical SAM enzyme